MAEPEDEEVQLIQQEMEPILLECNRRHDQILDRVESGSLSLAVAKEKMRENIKKSLRDTTNIIIKSLVRRACIDAIKEMEEP